MDSSHLLKVSRVKRSTWMDDTAVSVPVCLTEYAGAASVKDTIVGGSQKLYADMTPATTDKTMHALPRLLVQMLRLLDYLCMVSAITIRIAWHSGRTLESYDEFYPWWWSSDDTAKNTLCWE